MTGPKTASLTASLLASAAWLATSVVAHADTEATGLGDIVVTAQKRSESLQRVPVSVQALTTQKLEDEHVQQFEDYAKLLPSLNFQTTAPGQTNVYMRGVAAEGDQAGNHSGSLPSVGVYLDETPVTTIHGALDIHIYDIARIEALSGPQGTLYGASSQSGTLRIITNKPDTKEFSGAVDLTGTSSKGGLGESAEGYVNIPITEKLAIRLVGWEEFDPGYIDNIHNTRTYPSSGVTIDNANYKGQNLVKDNYNDNTTYGGRLGLKADISDDWTAEFDVNTQDERSHGVFGGDLSLGALKVSHYNPDSNHDQFYLAGLTVTGKIGRFDLTYNGSYMERWIDSSSDYSDYSFWYDTLNGSGAYFTSNDGTIVDPTQYIIGHDKFTKQSHEIRISSPAEDRLRFVAGLFWEHQTHSILQDYHVDQLGTDFSPIGWPGRVWVTDQYRVDRDAAVFGQVNYNITDNLEITGGVRVFDARNSLYGFYGFGQGFSSHTGEARCIYQFNDTPRLDGGHNGAPCTNLNATTHEINVTHLARITYKFDPDKLIYATSSSGFRPGGVNRVGDLGNYSSDYLYNYEIGWKTAWLDNKLRWNGALYWENWDSFQFAFLGPNSVTVILNAPAAVIKGVETDLTWKITPNLTLSGAGSFNDARLDGNYVDHNGIEAPDGQQLPVTPFFKGNATARYDTPMTDDIDGFAQVSFSYTGRTQSDLRTIQRTILGPTTSIKTVDLSFGINRDSTTFEFFIKNLFDDRGQIYRYGECTAAVCAKGSAPAGSQGTGDIYAVPTHPQLFGIKISQKF